MAAVVTELIREVVTPAEVEVGPMETEGVAKCLIGSEGGGDSGGGNAGGGVAERQMGGGREQARL